ncbi:MAG TPA: hypothetical protein VJU84_12435 [Pyrinomonadaceae bacterium]|nr:hypothetical protein [Pyrinomonadaceae bacterium]
MTTSGYLSAAQNYADGVHLLFAPTAKTRAERGGVPATPDSELGARAEKLLHASEELTAQAQSRLTTTDDADEMTEASTQLLAKAVTDLTISAHLFQAAAEEGEKTPQAERRGPERSLSGSADVEEMLQILVGQARATRAVRSAKVPGSIAEARTGLVLTIDDSLTLISDRTGTTGKAALSGMLGIGLGQVGQAAGLLGQNLAQALGQADKLSYLYGLFRDFAFKAYESVIALLGPTVAGIVGQQVVNWVSEIKELNFFNGFLERIYGTQQTRALLLPLVNESKSDTPQYAAAIQEIEKLGEIHLRQTTLVDKLLKGLKYLGAVPIAVLPYGSLLMAAVYVAISGYVVLNGADYVDADRVKVFNRVRGVRQIVTANLSVA